MGDNLKKLIRDYISKVIPMHGKLYNFGKLTEYSSSQKDGETAILLRNDERATGYLILDPTKDFHELSYTCEEENFYLRIYPSDMNIKVQFPQVVKGRPIFDQAITKMDWVTPSPLEIRVYGNFSDHRNRMEKAAEEFKSGNNCKLYLPEIIDYP